MHRIRWPRTSSLVYTQTGRTRRPDLVGYARKTGFALCNAKPQANKSVDFFDLLKILRQSPGGCGSAGGFRAEPVKEGRKIAAKVYELYAYSDFIAGVKGFNHFGSRLELQKEQ